MKASLLHAIVIIASASSTILGQQSPDSIQKMEATGDTRGRAPRLREPPRPAPIMLLR